jgi:hypothetical protein
VKLRSFRQLVPSWARYDTWNVGIATLARPLDRVGELAPLKDVRWLPRRPALQFVADPFPYRYGGRDWLLVEQYGYAPGVAGRIARVDPSNPTAAIEPVIQRDRHISYPYTFVDGDVTYCAPEMSQEDGCVLYALDAAGRWTPRHHVLRGARLVDATFFRFGDRWWAFAAEPPPNHTHVLNAYFADRIEGPWTPHARNPIKRDAATARPAGRPFGAGGRIYRPAQDCSETYGGAVHVMEIDHLTPVDFHETIALRLEPDRTWPYPHGLHHLVVDGTRVYVDAKRTTVDWLLWLKALDQRGGSMPSRLVSTRRPA